MADLTKPSNARIYDYFLGGTHHWAVDRVAGARMLREFPLLRRIAQANRLFLHRAVRHLVRLGVRQFVDIGSGLPTMGATHEIADAALPGAARVVYVDHEPLAVAESQLLLEETGDLTRHAAVHADLRDPDALWQQVAKTGAVDVEQPVGLLLISVMHLQQPAGAHHDIGARCVARFRELMSPRSYLALSHLTDDQVPAAVRAGLAHFKVQCEATGTPVVWRTRAEIAALFGTLELVDPGLTWMPSWHQEESANAEPRIKFESPAESAMMAGVGCKPARS